MAAAAAPYGPDLAYVHDVGFSTFARRAAPGLLRLLRDQGVRQGLVVDLGCGPGLWAERLLREGYGVFGVDISAAMLARARRRAPAARFVRGSFLEVPLPPCDAVTALGECFNYVFDARNTPRGLQRLFARIHAALRPGGLLVFDVAEPGIGDVAPPRRHAVGADWAVLVEVEEDIRRQRLTRHITTFRRGRAQYRRSEETHRQRLHHSTELATTLARTGFASAVQRGYGDFDLGAGRAVLVARKPSR